MSDAGGDPAARGDAQGEPTGPDRWIRPFFEDSTLWPVLLVALGILVTFFTGVLLLAVRDRNYFTIAALVVVAWASADVARHDVTARRLGLASGSLLVLWVLSLAAAFTVVKLGFY